MPQGRSRLPDGDAARLRARPDAPSQSAAVGLHPLQIGGSRDGFLYVPASLPREAAPLLVSLHRAGGTSAQAVRLVRAQADRRGFAVLAPDSRRATWDAVAGRYGPDVRFLDDALTWAFSRLPASASRLAIGGFSDGASYALGLGLANGDLFGAVLAFSPGFVPAANRRGRPRVYVSHGTRDRVLPIARTSRVIVPAMQGAGYAVAYDEFAGGHEVPSARVDAGVAFWLGQG